MNTQVQYIGLALSLCLMAGLSRAQNTLPTSGNVGVGTVSPTKQFQVVGESELDGKVTIDGYVDVKDSMKVDRMVVDHDVKIKGESMFLDHAKFKDNVRIDGTAKFKGLQNTALNEDRFALLKPNGVLKAGGIGNTLYGNDCVAFDDGTNTIIPAPAWQSSPGVNTDGILFTGLTCPVRVGIGTNNPVYRLDVRGSGVFQNQLGVGMTTSFTGAQMYVQSTDQVGVCVEADYTTDYGYAIKALVDRDHTKAFGVFNSNNGLNGQDVFRVYGNGAVECKSVRISQGIWSDYVFADDYNLMSLTDLKKFIEENRHLPGIPSEQEVKESGLDVGESDAALLAKIEELTLYMIELNEQVQKLKAENQQLREEIKK